MLPLPPLSCLTALAASTQESPALLSMSFRENALLWTCLILFFLLISYIGRYSSLPRFWSPWPAEAVKALAEEDAVLYSLGGASSVPPMSPLSSQPVLGTLPLQSPADRQLVIQQLRSAGSFRRLPAKVLFIPKYGICARYQDVVWEVLFSEVQAVCFRDGKPGPLFWIDLSRAPLDSCFSAMAFPCRTSPDTHSPSSLPCNPNLVWFDIPALDLDVHSETES